MQNHVIKLILLIAFFLYFFFQCSNFSSDLEENNLEDIFSGGSLTTFDQTKNAFDLPAPNLNLERKIKFFNGNALFNVNWTAPGNAAVSGLGPVFNAKSCNSCHVRDGRGRPPKNLGPSSKFLSILVRLSKKNQIDSNTGGPVALDNYGLQIQNKTIGTNGILEEGRTSLTYEIVKRFYGDGESYTLQKPIYNFTWNFGDPESFAFSPRVAQQTYGLGLLAAIPEETILNFIEKQMHETENISGKANYVYDVQKNTKVLGRFGWKANQPNLKQQAAGAFLGDIGITTPLFPNTNCVGIQISCAEKPNGDNGHTNEASENILDLVTFYIHLVSVPGRRNYNDESVKKGKKIFYNIGCTHCHISKIQTGILADFPEVSNQTIYPYTDLLLHDMGEELSDNRADFDANGREWRTPPLWGVGLIKKVNGHELLLHDSRARGFAEAILWHDGEAFDSRERFRNLNKIDRDNLVAFLKSL